MMVLYKLTKSLLLLALGFFAMACPCFAGDDRDSGTDIAVITKEPANKAYITHSGKINAEPWISSLGSNREISFLAGDFENTDGENKDDIACIDIDENNDAYGFITNSPGDSDSALWSQALSSSAHKYYYFLSGDFDGDLTSDLATFYRAFDDAHPESDVRAKITYGPDGTRQTSDEEDWLLSEELTAGFVKGRFVSSGSGSDAIDDIAAIRPVGADYQARFYVGGTGDRDSTSWDISSPSSASNPVAFGAGDFNGDGSDDIALAFYDDDAGSYTAQLVFGPTGASSTSWNLGSTVYESILFNDFDQDGLHDLAAVSDTHAGARTAKIFFGEADGSTSRTSLWTLKGDGEVTQYLTGNFGRYKTTISGTVYQRGGTVGLASAVLTLKDSGTGVVYQTTTSDSSGNYTFTDVVNSTYTITVSKIGHGFVPTTTSVTVYNALLSGINFTSTNDPVVYRISGRITTSADASIGLRGMVVTASGGNATSGVYDVRGTTDTNGYYSLQVTVGSFDVVPSNPHDPVFEFSPEARSVVVNSESVDDQDFTDAGNDDCPYDAAKVDPGACGCGVIDVDSDEDGNYDCVDLCPDDSAKSAPGLCGCGIVDSDINNNGVCDSSEPNYSISGKVLVKSNGVLVGLGGVVVHSAVGKATTRTLSDAKRDFPALKDPATKVGTFTISDVPKGGYTLWVRALEDNQGYQVIRYFDLSNNTARTHCPSRDTYQTDSSGKIVYDYKGNPALIDDAARKALGEANGGNGNLCRFDPVVVDRDLTGVDFKVIDCISGWAPDDDGYCVKLTELFSPTDVTATKGISTSQVTVSWTAAAGAREYRVYRAEASSFQSQIAKKFTKEQLSANGGISYATFLSTIQFTGGEMLGTTSTTSYADKSAVPGTRYVYAVKSVNKYAISDYSSADIGWRKTTGSDDGLYEDCNQSSDKDSDGDGYTNKEELDVGTDPCDRGSYIVTLKSPVYTKYNTFLNQRNFLELVSIGTKSVRVKITVYNIFGKAVGAARRFTIQPNHQIDISIHDWVNQVDTYGLVKIEFNDSISGVNLAGRMSIYRERPGQEHVQPYDRDYSFVFTRELRNPIKGTSYGLANSTDPQGTGNLIPNWVEIINLEGRTKTFNIRYYNEKGTLIYDRETALSPNGSKVGVVRIGARGERDVQGGHEFGPGSYLIEIIPKDGATSYFATISRYGGTTPADNLSDYNFAIPFEAKPGNGDRQFLPIANQPGTCWSQSNWINLVNTKQKKVQATVRFRDNRGSILATNTVKLAAHAQETLNAAALLGNGEYGLADITPSEDNSIIANAVYYYHDCQENELQSAYGLAALTAGSQIQYGSYNRYLDMRNILTIMNLYKSTTKSTLSVQNGEAETTATQTYSMRGYSTTQLNLNDENFETSADTYGTLKISANKKNRVAAVSTRIRESEGKVDFAMPTAVR